MPGRISLKATNKYHANKTTIDGITFDSKGEAKRWQDLLLLQKAGEITNLQRQVKFPILVNKVLITTYTADFTYCRTFLDDKGMTFQQLVVEDFKSKPTKTRDYAMRKKLMLACYSIVIAEVSGARHAGRTRKITEK